jgi:hypothetical protein
MSATRELIGRSYIASRLRDHVKAHEADINYPDGDVVPATFRSVTSRGKSKPLIMDLACVSGCCGA